MIWKTREGEEIEIYYMSDGHLNNTINYIEERFSVPGTPPITTYDGNQILRLIPSEKLCDQYEEMKRVLAERQERLSKSSEAMKNREINLFEFL